MAEVGVGGFSYLDEDLLPAHFTTSLLPHTPPSPFQLHHTHTTSHMMYFYFHMVVQTQIRMSYVMLCANDAMASKEEKRVFL